MRTHLSLLLLVLLLTTIFLGHHGSEARKEPLLGGWQPIKNTGDPHVREIGEYAVTEHNKEAKASLAFGKVIKGETQVVSGVNYRLVVEAKDGVVAGKYEAVVWEKASVGFKQLTSFKKITS